uniref:Reverse transcriptase Ty1/copia-type domain-containing protein n=1 Tax=Lactuca sativa TaxID=4236 RepID=A0A9R1XR60_LACSA|nr:hypothetical protein LSAT_V11C100008830 [Lactuca sativa]
MTLKETVNSMLSYSGLSAGFWGEAMLTACNISNKNPNKRSKNTPYELWCKKVPNLSCLKVWGCRAVVRLTETKRKTLGERGVDCIFIRYAEHSKAYRFYVLESNDYVSVNTVIESKDALFDEERFTSIPRPRDMIQQFFSKNTTQAEDTYGGTSSMHELKKSTRARKAKSFGSDFQLYLVQGTRDTIVTQHQYCFTIKEDPKTFSEAMASRDVHFWKEAIQDEIDSIMHNNTWVLFDLPPGCKALGCKWILKRKMKVDGTIDKYKARLTFYYTAIHNLVIPQIDVKSAFLNGDLDEEIYMKQPEGFVIPGKEHKVCKTPIYPSLKLLPNVCLMYVMTSTRPDIAYVVGRLSRYSRNPSTHHWQAVSRVFKIKNLEDHATTSGWVFLLGGGAISWASKKHTCITSSTMESEFVALYFAGKEVEWMRNLIYEIPVWPKPKSTIYIRCDSVATFAKTYSQVYNGKSRHLGVRHSMIRELMMTGVIYVSQPSGWNSNILRVQSSSGWNTLDPQPSGWNAHSPTLTITTMGPIIHQDGIPQALNHRVGMPTYYESNHPTGMEYSWPTTIGLECPPTMSPIILPGWKTPGPQPSGWKAHILTNMCTYRIAI